MKRALAAIYTIGIIRGIAITCRPEYIRYLWANRPGTLPPNISKAVLATAIPLTIATWPIGLAWRIRHHLRRRREDPIVDAIDDMLDKVDRYVNIRQDGPTQFPFPGEFIQAARGAAARKDTSSDADEWGGHEW